MSESDSQKNTYQVNTDDLIKRLIKYGFFFLSILIACRLVSEPVPLKKSVIISLMSAAVIGVIDSAYPTVAISENGEMVLKNSD